MALIANLSPLFETFFSRHSLECRGRNCALITLYKKVEGFTRTPLQDSHTFSSFSTRGGQWIIQLPRTKRFPLSSRLRTLSSSTYDKAFVKKANYRKHNLFKLLRTKDSLAPLRAYKTYVRPVLKSGVWCLIYLK